MCNKCAKTKKNLYKSCPNCPNFICNSCCAIWKRIGEVVVTDTKEDKEVLFGADTIELDFEETPFSMQDILHKCIRCNATSFEVGPNFYRCPDCGFEWEILQ